YVQLASEYDFVLVEGAGGLLVPLTEDQNYVDLCALLDLPMVVVARNVLGTINHTALTVTVAAQRCHVCGIVLNTLEPQDSDSSQASNIASLRRWGRAPLLGAVPYTREHTAEALAHLGAGIDVAALLT
ncbi:MAG: ATP-dependent dethiobiotin synthetase BioD, partial [Ktedonobacteraceae bacterium]